MNTLIPISSYPMPSDENAQITVRTEEKAEAAQALSALGGTPDSPAKRQAEQTLREYIDAANTDIRRRTVKKQQEDARAQQTRLQKANEETALGRQDERRRLDARA